MIVKLVSFFFCVCQKFYYQRAITIRRPSCSCGWTDRAGCQLRPLLFCGRRPRGLCSRPNLTLLGRRFRPALMLFVHFGQMELAFYLVFGHWTRLCRRCPHPPTEREAGGRWTSFARRPGCCVDPFFRGLWSIHRTVPFFVCPSLVHLGAAVCSRYLVLTRFPND